MKERLSKIIAAEGITSSLLAEELGVQRSGISHILSGRNYPSFDFLQKLLERFPKLNAEWLITGQGSMYKSSDTNKTDLFLPVEKTPPSPTLPDKQPILSHTEDDRKTLLEDVPKYSPPKEVKKTIEKMFIFYSDKTFATYLPES